MSYTARRHTGLSIVSMLDLLFGLFGSMIVLAIMLSYFKQRETIIPQVPFVHVEITLTSPNRNVNLSRLFMEFQIEKPGRTVIADWGPNPVEGPPDEARYFVATGKDSTTASLWIPGSLLSAYNSAVLRPELHNIADLLHDARSETLYMTAMIRTAHNSCAVASDVTIDRLLQLDRDIQKDGRAPSPFAILAGLPTGPKELCTGSASNPNGLNLEVDADGAISLSYQTP